ncbi:MAG: hypothetical protein Q9187_003991 [Circinaria calcarea]
MNSRCLYRQLLIFHQDERPEAVLKARKKNKRSKTTGDIRDIKPSLVNDGPPTVAASKDTNQPNLSEVYEAAKKAQSLVVEVKSVKRRLQVTEDTIARNKADYFSKPIDHASPANVLSDAKDTANNIQLLPRISSPEATPVSIQALLAPFQTQRKHGEKGPNLHNPSNSGKIGYRVGLSKKQRIEPLLRGVRK